MSKSLKQKLVAYGLVLPAFLVVMLTVAYPIISAVIQSFQDEDTGAWTLDNYKYFCTLRHCQIYWYAVPAAKICACYVCSLRDDHHYP